MQESHLENPKISVLSPLQHNTVGMLILASPAPAPEIPFSRGWQTDCHSHHGPRSCPTQICPLALVLWSESPASVDRALPPHTSSCLCNYSSQHTLSKSLLCAGSGAGAGECPSRAEFMPLQEPMSWGGSADL